MPHPAAARRLSWLAAAASAAASVVEAGPAQLRLCARAGLALAFAASLFARRWWARPRRGASGQAVSASRALWVLAVAGMLAHSCRALASGAVSDSTLTAGIAPVMLAGYTTPRTQRMTLITVGCGSAVAASALAGGSLSVAVVILCLACLALRVQIAACSALKTLYLQELRMSSKAYHFYELLTRMLPPPLARRYFKHCLGAPSAADAMGIRVCMGERVSQCGVLFLAIHDFDQLVAGGSQRAIVRFLNTFFSSLDTACDAAGPAVMKLGTYGEVYVAACGLLPGDGGAEEGGAEARRLPEGMAALAALARTAHDLAGQFPVQRAGPPEEGGAEARRLPEGMAALAALARTAHDLAGQFPVQLRAGLHCGPVVAGIVGDHLPRFQIYGTLCVCFAVLEEPPFWPSDQVLGDTMNRAARLEQHCPPGQVLLSDAAADLLRGAGFGVEERGPLSMWGLGDIPAFQLQCPPPPPAGPQAQQAPRAHSKEGPASCAGSSGGAESAVVEPFTPGSAVSRCSSLGMMSVPSLESLGFASDSDSDSDCPEVTPSKTPTHWLSEEEQFGFGRGAVADEEDNGGGSADLDEDGDLPLSIEHCRMGIMPNAERDEFETAVRQLEETLLQPPGPKAVRAGPPAEVLRAEAARRAEALASPLLWALALVLLLALRCGGAGGASGLQASAVAAAAAPRRASGPASHLAAAALAAGCFWAAHWEQGQGAGRLPAPPAQSLVAWAWLALGAAAHVPLGVARASCAAGLAAAALLRAPGPALATLSLVALQQAGRGLDRRRQVVEQLALQAQERMRAAAETVMPPSVVCELRMARFGSLGQRQNPCVWHSYPLVTVLQTDLAGFTAFSHIRRPEEVLWVLNCLFSVFDSLAKEHHVYKMETIGDAYVCVSGLPDYNDGKHSACLMLLVATEFVSAIARFQDSHSLPRDLSLRAGLHSGPGVGGVVGTAMQRYHLFGQTVRIAEVLEATAPRNGIHLSGATRDQYALELGGALLPAPTLAAARALRFEELRRAGGLTTSKGEAIGPEAIGGLSTFLVRRAA
ncbi:unnamed protein product [Prorocentrum cordatum]|uniref:Guanylate cyclase domain-containing protein n=1 Tax=Prorocentrum cordatum TaxID=2364126 RepID=A0ABN9XU69_9DINO|nr:unnamed protein product [Polarella glacialis]